MVTPRFLGDWWTLVEAKRAIKERGRIKKKTKPNKKIWTPNTIGELRSIMNGNEWPNKTRKKIQKKKRSVISLPSKCLSFPYCALFLNVFFFIRCLSSVVSCFLSSSHTDTQINRAIRYHKLSAWPQQQTPPFSRQKRWGGLLISTSQGCGRLTSSRPFSIVIVSFSFSPCKTTTAWEGALRNSRETEKKKEEENSLKTLAGLTTIHYLLTESWLQ